MITPNRKRTVKDRSGEIRGSTPYKNTDQKAVYIPSITRSPWAKLMMSITPHIRVRPMLIRA